MFSEDGEVTEERLDRVVEEAESFVRVTSKPTQLGLRAALFLLRLLPLVLFVRFATLERLSVGERTWLLSRLERSGAGPLALAFVGWRAILTLVFYEDAAELRALGYRDERHRHTRRLPVVTPSLTGRAATAIARPSPPPLESGVRLRDVSDHGADLDGEPPMAADPGARRDVA